MKDKKYYWTLAILGVLLLFVVVCDALGFVDGVVDLFTGGDAVQTQVVTEAAQEDAPVVVELPAADEVQEPAGAEDPQTVPDGAAE